MTRRLATMAAMVLAVAACGGGDDAEPAAVDEPAADEQPGDEPTTEEPVADDVDEGGDADADDGAGAGGDADADDGADAGGDEDDGSAIVVRSVDDIPERCRELMGEYFREVEPVVADVDWSNAGFGALEEVGAELEEASAAFDDDIVAAGCDDIDFPDGNDFELLVEFARDEAPGVVGYLEFLDGFGVDSDDGTDTEAGEDALPTPGEEFADCGEAVTYVQGLMDEYGTFMDVPPAEIMQIAGLSAVIQTCTPDEMAFFDSPEVTAFLEGG